MNPFLKFMSSITGRATRIVAGLALIATGALLSGAGWFLAAAGLIPLLAGLLDICLFAPLFRAPFTGRKIRSQI